MTSKKGTSRKRGKSVPKPKPKPKTGPKKPTTGKPKPKPKPKPAPAPAPVSVSASATTEKPVVSTTAPFQCGGFHGCAYQARSHSDLIAHVTKTHGHGATGCKRSITFKPTPTIVTYVGTEPAANIGRKGKAHRPQVLPPPLPRHDLWVASGAPTQHMAYFPSAAAQPQPQHRSPAPRLGTVAGGFLQHHHNHNHHHRQYPMAHVAVPTTSFTVGGAAINRR